MTSLRNINKPPLVAINQPDTGELLSSLGYDESYAHELEVKNLSQAETGMALEQEISALDETISTGLTKVQLAEDLISVSESSELSKDAISLTQIACDLICATTDLKASDDLIPGLESAQGHKVSLESFRDRLADFWERLMNLVVKIYDKFLLFIDNARTQAEGAASRAEMLEERLNRLRVGQIKGKVNLGEQTRRVLLDGKVLSPRNFTLQLKKTSAQVEQLLIKNTDFVITVAKKAYPRIEETLSLIDKGDDHGLDLAAQKLQFIAEQGHLVRRRFDSPQEYFLTNYVSEAEFSIKESEPLLGERRLEGKLRTYDPSTIRSSVGMNLLKVVDAIYGSEVGLRNTEQYMASIPELDVLSVSEMRSVLESVKATAKNIVRFKLRYDTVLRSLRNDFKNLRNKSRSLARQGENDQLKWYIRRSGNAAHGFTRWLHTPAIPYITHTLRVVSASLTYVEKSISASRQK